MVRRQTQVEAQLAEIEREDSIARALAMRASGGAFPVGAVYINVTGVNPGTELGYGTWSAFGAGRVMVGYNSGDVDFNTAEKTGGAKTVAAAGSVSAPTISGSSASGTTGISVGDHASHTHVQHQQRNHWDNGHDQQPGRWCCKRDHKRAIGSALALRHGRWAHPRSGNAGRQCADLHWFCNQRGAALHRLPLLEAHGMTLEPFLPEHLQALKLQAAQSSAQPLMTSAHGLEIIAAPGQAWTGLIDGRPIACAGMIEFWKGRAYAWAYLGEDFKKYAKSVHRATMAMLAGAPWRRVEMTVDVNHGAAKRWAAHLGFEREGICRAWTTDGRDVELWARVN